VTLLREKEFYFFFSEKDDLTSNVNGSSLIIARQISWMRGCLYPHLQGDGDGLYCISLSEIKICSLNIQRVSFLFC